MLFENETLTLSSGELCIISPGSMHDMYASDDSIAVSIMIRKDTFENTFFRLLSQKNLLADFSVQSFIQKQKKQTIFSLLQIIPL